MSENVKVTERKEHKNKDNTVVMYYVKWDAVSYRTDKAYRACSGTFTDRKEAETFAASKPNPELIIDYCAGFLF